MSIYCGASFGGGQGYADKCGVSRGYMGDGELDQCHSCQKKEIESLRKDAERYRQFRALTLNGLDDTPDEFDKEFDMQISSPENPS